MVTSLLPPKVEFTALIVLFPHKSPLGLNWSPVVTSKRSSSTCDLSFLSILSLLFLGGMRQFIVFGIPPLSLDRNRRRLLFSFEWNCERLLSNRDQKEF